jgi:hypothetical protein
VIHPRNPTISRTEPKEVCQGRQAVPVYLVNLLQTVIEQEQTIAELQEQVRTLKEKAH